jgi:hypothetical protein
MQITKNLILLAVCAATASAVTVPDTAIADECSNLGGVMSIPDHELPRTLKPSMFAGVLSTLSAASVILRMPLWLPGTMLKWSIPRVTGPENNAEH